VAFGAGKMSLVISQGGQSDIYVGNPDGSALSKVTQGGLNTHPAFGPGGELAYVSNAGGNPQIYVSGKRVSWVGTYNMAPTWCNDPEGTKLVYMGRAGATWDIFSVDPGGSQASMKRLTQDQGSNTYPACSPDGRRTSRRSRASRASRCAGKPATAPSRPRALRRRGRRGRRRARRG